MSSIDPVNSPRVGQTILGEVSSVDISETHIPPEKSTEDKHGAYAAAEKITAFFKNIINSCALAFNRLDSLSRRVTMLFNDIMKSCVDALLSVFDSEDPPPVSAQTLSSQAQEPQVEGPESQDEKKSGTPPKEEGSEHLLTPVSDVSCSTTPSAAVVVSTEITTTSTALVTSKNTVFSEEERNDPSHRWLLLAELDTMIASSFNPEELRVLALVSKWFNEVANSNEVWKAQYQREFSLDDVKDESKNENWKSKYKQTRVVFAPPTYSINATGPSSKTSLSLNCNHKLARAWHLKTALCKQDETLKFGNIRIIFSGRELTDDMPLATLELQRANGIHYVVQKEPVIDGGH